MIRRLICLVVGHDPCIRPWGNEYISAFAGNAKDPVIHTKLCDYCHTVYTEVTAGEHEE